MPHGPTQATVNAERAARRRLTALMFRVAAPSISDHGASWGYSTGGH